MEQKNRNIPEFTKDVNTKFIEIDFDNQTIQTTFLKTKDIQKTGTANAHSRSNKNVSLFTHADRKDLQILEYSTFVHFDKIIHPKEVLT